MHVWIINPFDNIPGDAQNPGRYLTLATVLVEAGHTVEWFSADWDHLKKRPRGQGTGQVEVNPRFKVTCLPVRPYRRNISLARILSHRDFARQLGLAIQENPQPPDLIVVSLPVREAVESACNYAQPRGIPVVVDIQDLWPEALPLLFPRLLRPLLGPAVRVLKWWDDKVMRKATAVFAVCDAYRQRGLTAWPKGAWVPSSYVYIGVDLDRFDAVKGSFVPEDGDCRPYMVFCGTVGKMADLWVALSAMEILQERGKGLPLRVFGDGPELAALRSYARQRSIQVVFHGRRPWEECVRAIRSAIVGLNVYRQVKNAVSNKVFEYMAGGVPVLNSVSGEVADLIREHGLGRNFAAADALSLAEAMTAVLDHPQEYRKKGLNARRFVEQYADRKISYQRYVRFLESLVCG